MVPPFKREDGLFRSKSFKIILFSFFLLTVSSLLLPSRLLNVEKLESFIININN